MKICGVEVLVNLVYFCNIKFLLLLEDVEHLVLTKWVIRKSELRTGLPVCHYRKVFPEVMRTIFYRTCSQLLHTKKKIKNHDPVKWGIGFSNGIFKYRSCTVSTGGPSVIKSHWNVFLKLQCWQLYHELWPFRYIYSGLLLKSCSLHLCQKRKAKASWRLMGYRRSLLLTILVFDL